MSIFSDSRFYVVGLARTGLAAIDYLLGEGSCVYVWDDSAEVLARGLAEKSRASAIAISPIEMEESGFYDGLHGVLLSPGIGDDHAVVGYARGYGVPLISDVSLFAVAYPRARCIALTGTNGKTTVCMMLAHVLGCCGVEAYVGGNIGEAILRDEVIAAASDFSAKETFFVLELSSYQLERLAAPRGFSERFRCERAILLNIAPDHLERHKTMENYVPVKGSLFDYLHAGGKAIVGVDDSHSASIYEDLWRHGREAIAISGCSRLDGGIGVRDGILWDGVADEAILDLGAHKYLFGAHNAQNLAAVYGALCGYGFSGDLLRDGLLSFRPPRHRQERIGRKGRLLFINDSKATNSSATVSALRSFRRIYWLAGGMVKEDDFSLLYGDLAHVCRGYFFGRDREILQKDLQGRIACDIFSDLRSALLQAVADAERSGEESVILLSPAAASFDSFRDFTHRGRVFTELVGELLDVSKNPNDP